MNVGGLRNADRIKAAVTISKEPSKFNTFFEFSSEIGHKYVITVPAGEI